MRAKEPFNFAPIFIFSLIICFVFISCEKERGCTDVDNDIYYVQDEIGVMLDSNNHSGISSPHTISVVRPNKYNTFNDHTYWIYVGEQKSGNIDLWFAEDLENINSWVAYESNPIISGNQARWPTVIFEEDTFWMVHTVEYSHGAYSIMKSSIDGIHFMDYKIVYADFSETRSEGHFNPFLFQDPISKSFVLLQQFDDGAVEQIKMKIAKKIPDLIDAEPLVVGQTSDGIWSKAPSIFYHNEVYWILSEGVENYPIEKNWNTYAYRSSDLEGPYIKADSSLILTENTACPFPYVENGILYNFVCFHNDTNFTQTERWKTKLHISTLCR